MTDNTENTRLPDVSRFLISWQVTPSPTPNLLLVIRQHPFRIYLRYVFSNVPSGGLGSLRGYSLSASFTNISPSVGFRLDRIYFVVKDRFASEKGLRVVWIRCPASTFSTYTAQ